MFEDWNPVGKPVRFLSTRENFQDLARKNPDAHFALEACGVQEWMIDTLRQAGVKADAYTPPTKESKARKSDPKDALRLGRKVLLQGVNVVRVPTPQERRLRDRVRQRQYLVAERTKFIQRVRHALNQRGVRPVHADPDDEDTEDSDGKTLGILTPAGRAQVLAAIPDAADDYAVLDVLTARRNAMDKELRELGKEIPEVQLLKTIPGFDDVIALAFHVETGPVTRFAKAGHLVNYYGLDPEGRQSGDTYVDLHRISRKGRSYLRGLMTQASWVHVRHCEESDIAQKYGHLVNERGKIKGKAIVAVAAHLVRAAWTVLIEKRAFTIHPPARRNLAGSAQAVAA